MIKKINKIEEIENMFLLMKLPTDDMKSSSQSSS